MGPVKKSIEPNRPGTHSVYTGQPRDLRFELAFVLVRRQPRLAPEMDCAHGHDHGLLDGADAAPPISDACFPAQAGKPSLRNHAVSMYSITGSQVRSLRNRQLTARLEQLTLNQRVPGSSPGAPTKQAPNIPKEIPRPPET